MAEKCQPETRECRLECWKSSRKPEPKCCGQCSEPPESGKCRTGIWNRNGTGQQAGTETTVCSKKYGDEAGRNFEPERNNQSEKNHKSGENPVC